MGGGSYSQASRATRAQAQGYDHKPASELFERRLNEGLNPHGLIVRESRDSVEHPKSLAIAFALDETGSMGYIPEFLVREGLPQIMGKIIEHGIPDPQVMFIGIGDHKTDKAPLQVSQFESSDEMLDHWLTKLYLEGNGGGNNGESYSLAHYIAGYHTSIDCFEKRGQKGFLFTIGDDKPHPSYPADTFKRLMGASEATNRTSDELLAKARETYNVYHIHVGDHEASSGVHNYWREKLGEKFIIVRDPANLAAKIVEIVCANAGTPEDIASFNNRPEEQVVSGDDSQPVYL